jgi:hypothetical protein
MRPPNRLTRSAAVLLGLLVAACTGGGSAVTPGSPGHTGAPATASASATAVATAPLDASTYWLRLTTSQAIPPLSRFGLLDPLVVTGTGVAVTPAAVVPTVAPGPAVMPLEGRAITDAGRARIMQLATDLGLQGSRTDFVPETGLVGGIIGHVELTADDGRVELTGLPDAGGTCLGTACNAAPGTPEAFGAFWRQLLDLGPWLGSDLGTVAPYAPDGYSILVGPAPAPDPAVGAGTADWPLDTPLATFGTPVANGTRRCGTVTGADAAAMAGALATANAQSQWVQDPGTDATFGLQVQPLVTGEDACRAIFGAG